MKTKTWMPLCAALALVGWTAACGKTAAAKSYPLQTCIVTGEKLGSMGDPSIFVHDGQEIKLCCGGCRDDFDKEPAKYLAKLSAPKKP